MRDLESACRLAAKASRRGRTVKGAKQQEGEMKRRLLLVLALALVTLGAASGAAAQHNLTGAGHLLDPILPAGTTQNADGSWGKIEFLGKFVVSDAEEGLIADVAVDPDGDYAYLA
ncbi:MAG: hypothetical protein H0U00_03455, partial [Actinobacteria bacterium]|nr:hypothetical protein [Actinomycetota bacterium]